MKHDNQDDVCDDQTFTDLLARAEAGAANSQYTLGFIYEHGLYGAPQDAGEAVIWYRLAAAQGYVAAQFSLGVMYDQGRNVTQDDIEAHMWLNLAASRSSGEERERAVAARDAVAARLTPADLHEAQHRARKWRMGASITTRDRALAFLGGYVSTIVRITVAVATRCLAMLSSPTPARAFADLRVRGETGNAEAQSTLGFIYDFGVGVLEDAAEAVAWYRKAAAQGDATAQNNLGRMHADGKGVPQNDVEAVAWFHLAAEQGYAHAQKNLGVMYDQGRVVPEDDVEAVAWYRLAAEQGDAAAQFSLGWMYAEGRVVPGDPAEAVRWYRLAAEQGDTTAQVFLGASYAEGRGVLQDYVEAVAWYRLAAEQGDARAQFSLGNMYAEGRGVPQDDVEAHMWLNLAASRSTRAVGARDAVAARLTPTDLREAQRLAREWTAPH